MTSIQAFLSPWIGHLPDPAVLLNNNTSKLMQLQDSPLSFIALESVLDHHPLKVAPNTLLVEIVALLNQERLSTPTQFSQQSASNPQKAGASCVLVIEEEQLVGLITERDFVQCAARMNKDGMKAADVMNPQRLITLVESDFRDIFTLLNLFHEHQICHLPILNAHRKLLGVVTPERICQALPTLDFLKKRSLEEVMVDVIQAPPNALVMDIVQLMVKHQVDCVVITEETPGKILQPVGIVTVRDLLYFQALKPEITLTAQTVMNSSVIWASPEHSLWMAHQEMQQQGVGQLLVRGSKGECLGMINPASVLGALDPREMYRVIEVLQQKVELLETEKLQLLHNRRDALEQEIMERTVTLQEQAELYQQAQSELQERRKMEEALRELNEELENRVKERTAQLMNLNEELVCEFGERVHTESALRESEARFRAAAEGSLDAFFIFQSLRDERGRIIDFIFADLNSNGETMISMSREEVIGKRLGELFPLSRTLVFFKKFVRVVETGIVLEEEVPVSLPNLTAPWLHYQVVPLSDSATVGSPRASGIAITVRDITGRKLAEEALHHSEQRYRSVVDNVTEVIFQTDASGCWTFLNPAWTEITGFDIEKSLGTCFIDYVHPDDRQRNLELFRPLVERQKDHYRHEIRYLTKNGDFRWIEVYARFTLAFDGTIIGTSGTLNDITERKQAQQALQESEATNRALLNAIPDLMFRLREDGTYLDFKAAKDEELFLSADTFIGKKVEEVVPLEVAQQTMFYVKQALLTKEIQIFEIQLQIPARNSTSKETHNYEVRIAPSRTNEVLCIVRNITERKQTEVAMRQAEERYRSIFENSVKGLFQTTPDGRYLSANPALARIYGYNSPEELIESLTNINQHFYVDAERRIQFLELMQTEDRVSHFESQAYRQDGKIIWVSENAHVVRDGQGKPLYYEGSVVDITERKVWEEALRYQQECTEDLLLNILPAPIAERLKFWESTIADSFAAVTVLFADLVNFTEFSAQIPPAKLVALLNKIFSKFDQLADKHGLEKIKTIGDAYMVVGGLPTPRADHADAIAQMALEMQQAITDFKRDNGEPFQVRIGIHTGPVVAGVIGMKRFAYDLWGDTVNVASRMESQGIAGNIQVTAEIYEQLKDKYNFEKRGTIAVKGKGEMITYWLKGSKVCYLRPVHP